MFSNIFGREFCNTIMLKFDVKMANSGSIFYMISLVLIAEHVHCDDSLTITISFASDNECAKVFFSTQLTPEILEQYKPCPIQFDVIPCASSAIVGGVLTCLGPDTTCKSEKIQTCSKLEFTNPFDYAKVASCLMTGGEPAKCTDKLWKQVEDCSNSELATKKCNEYWDVVNNSWSLADFLSIVYGKVYDETVNQNAVLDFKKVTCEQLKAVNLECGVCS